LWDGKITEPVATGFVGATSDNASIFGSVLKLLSALGNVKKNMSGVHSVTVGCPWTDFPRWNEIFEWIAWRLRVLHTHTDTGKLIEMSFASCLKTQLSENSTGSHFFSPT
jgi:hypothetical protein